MIIRTHTTPGALLLALKVINPTMALNSVLITLTPPRLASGICQVITPWMTIGHSVPAGAVLLPLPQGAAFHRRATANEPRLMVSTNGIAGIPIDGNDDYTNTFGYAVVPMISSYQPTTIAVNMDDLPDGVTVSENTVRETWTEGAIGYKVWHLAQVKRLM